MPGEKIRRWSFFHDFDGDKQAKFREKLPLKKSGKNCYNYTITRRSLGNTEHKEVMIMFQTGSYVTYGKRGVCRIEETGCYFKETMHDSREYYKMKPVFSAGDTVYIPVENQISIRRILTSEEARECIEEIPRIQPEIFRCRQQTRLAAHYQEMVSSCDPRILLAVIKECYIKKKEAEESHKKLGQVDARFMKCAEDLTYGELAVALDTTPDQVKRFVLTKMNGEKSSAAL